MKRVTSLRGKKGNRKREKRRGQAQCKVTAVSSFGYSYKIKLQRGTNECQWVKNGIIYKARH